MSRRNISIPVKDDYSKPLLESVFSQLAGDVATTGLVTLRVVKEKSDACLRFANRLTTSPRYRHDHQGLNVLLAAIDEGWVKSVVLYKQGDEAVVYCSDDQSMFDKMLADLGEASKLQLKVMQAAIRFSRQGTTDLVTFSG